MNVRVLHRPDASHVWLNGAQNVLADRQSCCYLARVDEATKVWGHGLVRALSLTGNYLRKEHLVIHTNRVVASKADDIENVMVHCDVIIWILVWRSSAKVDLEEDVRRR